MSQNRIDKPGAPHIPLTRGKLKQAGIVVKQSMPGRMRVRISGLRYQPAKAQWMRRHLQLRDGVAQVETRSSSGSVIVHFEVENITVRELLEQILAQVIAPTIYDWPEPSSAPQSAMSPDCTCDTPVALKSKLRRMVLLTGFVVYAVIRSWMFKLPLAQNPISLVALVAFSATVPLIREATVEMAAKKGITLKPFLAAGCVLTIAMGEAFTALEIIWVYHAAELTEGYVALRSRRAIATILDVAPANAFVMVDGMEVETKVADIRPDDVVAIHTGEKIPVDGVVTEGEALVDEASINGRAEVALRRAGDAVYAGTIVSQGTMFIRTLKTGEATYLANVMRLVEESLANKAPVELKADELARRLLKTGFAATALTLVLTADPLRALTVMLVMACPCATVLATSTAIMAAVANAAKRHILIKGGYNLEVVGRADVYCFDKTGTLTMGQPEIVGIIGRTPSISDERILSMAATAESHNQHPMARAILAAAKARGIDPEPHAVCQFETGRGVLCTMRGGEQVYLVGNQIFMESHGVDIRWFRRQSDAQKKSGHTVVYVAQNGKAQGMLAVANRVRPKAVKVLRSLRADGVKSIHLVTGDNEYVAQTMLTLFDFDDCRSELLPEDKAKRLEALKHGNTVAMVGDGINDALALAQADIGIAMGAGGAEVAVEAADIALADSNLESLMKMRNLSHRTMSVVDQNYLLAISTDLLGAALALTGFLAPVMAGLIHIVHTGGIFLNSSRLLNWEPPATPMKRCRGCIGFCPAGYCMKKVLVKKRAQ